jgi:hypothetical protein
VAVAKQKPVLANPIVAGEAMRAHLPLVLAGLGAKSIDEVGWRALGDLGLLVPVAGRTADSKEPDSFYLRLEFYHYPDWPPSAQFVNPETLGYVRNVDQYWLPKIEGGEIHVHEHHDDLKRQLICCSATLEFYEVLHDVKAEYLWDPASHTFAHTINQIEWGLRSPRYKGRFRATRS